MSSDSDSVSRVTSLPVVEVAGGSDVPDGDGCADLNLSGWRDAEPVRIAVAALQQGAIVAYPTDTVYGLAADPRRPDAVARLFRAKQRTRDLAIPVIAADAAQVSRIGRLSTIGATLAATFWPGPLTLVIDADPGLDPQLLGGRDTVAVRVPRSLIGRGLARGLGYPVTATSANRSGVPVCRTAQEIVTMLGPDLSLILDGGPSASARPSTIVDVSQNVPVLIRDGVVPWERVLQSLA